MSNFLIRNFKPPLFILTFAFLAFSGFAQDKNDNNKVLPTGFSKSVSTGLNISLPEFNQTHTIGVGVNFTWSKNRLGLMKQKPSKAFGFIADGGIDYYFGNNETVSFNSYTYNNFTYIHAYAGIIYNLCKRGNINLVAGPALGLEGGFTTFFWGANLGGSYYVTEKIAITPAIQFMKDPDSYDPLLSVALKGSWAF